MKVLISILKEVELLLRAGQSLPVSTLERLADLSDWEYRIVQDFMLRVRLAMDRNDLNFQYKYYMGAAATPRMGQLPKVDLLVATLKRDQSDTVLTDVVNRLVFPKSLSWTICEIWGLPVTQARNKAVQEALRIGCSYLLFVDDDIVAPNNALLRLWELMESEGALVVAGNYSRKVEPLLSAHGTLEESTISESVKYTDLCAMGFTLIKVGEVAKQVPFPLFWEFGAPDGYWSLGEDAFFTKNLFEYTGQKPLVDTGVKLLHFDKVWKRSYGERDSTVTYATNAILNEALFEDLRRPPKFPLILVAVPTRKEGDPIAVDLNKLLLMRGYRSEFYTVHGLPVDQARQACAQEALRRDAEFLLFVDDDIIPPRDGLLKLIDLLERNLSAGVASGDYLLKGSETHSAHLNLDGDGVCTELNRCSDQGALVESNWMIGLGFALIRTEVFKQLRTPWFLVNGKKTPKDGGEDAFFTELVLQSGYRVLVDRSLNCLHVAYSANAIYGYQEALDWSGFAAWPWLEQLRYVPPTKVVPKLSLKPNRIPTVLVGIPQRAGDTQIATELTTLRYPKGFLLEGVFPRGLKVADARNLLVQEALARNFDYLFFIDDDVVVPPEALLRLLEMEAPVAAGVYPMKDSEYALATLVETEGGLVSLDRSQMFKANGGKGNVWGPFWAVTMGCTLINTTVFRSLPEPWFMESSDPQNSYTEDVYFTQQCLKAGVRMVVNLDLKCNHVEKQTGTVYSCR